jgi:DNA-binding response OmpR family regulator
MLYLFENYSLDSDRRELRRAGMLVAVEPQVFDVLHNLIRNRERGQQERVARRCLEGTRRLGCNAE